MAADYPSTNDNMKKTIKAMFLTGLLTFLFGCKQTTVNKDNLIGIWEGEKQNNMPIKDQGFNSIKLTFTNDSVEVFVDMKAFGGHVTTKSIGPWTLDKNTIKVKFGKQEQECTFTIEDGMLTFKPDLFFKTETVLSSQYKRSK